MGKPDSIFDDVDDEALADAVAQADAAVVHGDVVPHADVMDWLAAMARGERPPPPGRPFRMLFDAPC